MSLKPKRVEVDCVFECQECGCETWYTVRELKYRKYLDCPCGKKTRIEPVCHVEVTYATKTTEQFDKSGENPSLTVPELPVDDFVSTLAGLGHKRADARKLVLANADDYDGDDGKFITFLIQQGS